MKVPDGGKHDDDLRDLDARALRGFVGHVAGDGDIPGPLKELALGLCKDGIPNNLKDLDDWITKGQADETQNAQG